MQERDPKKYSMATEEHALKIRRPCHCQSELSRLSTENVSKSGEQPKAIIRAREDHVNSVRLAPRAPCSAAKYFLITVDNASAEIRAAAETCKKAEK